MMVLVDTSVWSVFLRRSAPEPIVHNALKTQIEDGNAVLIGPIRQEILSGVRDQAQFDRLRSVLGSFPDEPLFTEDYELAAQMSNTCRAHGVQGSGTDFLICSVSCRLSAPIFTLDNDFQAFARVLSVSLFPF